MLMMILLDVKIIHSAITYHLRDIIKFVIVYVKNVDNAQYIINNKSDRNAYHFQESAVRSIHSVQQKLINFTLQEIVGCSQEKKSYYV